jgi:hypothetical protein
VGGQRYVLTALPAEKDPVSIVQDTSTLASCSLLNNTRTDKPLRLELRNFGCPSGYLKDIIMAAASHDRNYYKSRNVLYQA